MSANKINPIKHNKTNKQKCQNNLNIFFLIAPQHGTSANKLQRNTWTLLTLWAPGSSSPGGFFLSTYFFEGVWMRKVGFDWPALQRRQLCRSGCLEKLMSTGQRSQAAIQWKGVQFNYTRVCSTCCRSLTCTAWQRASRCSRRSSSPTGNSKVSQRQTCAEAALALSFRPCLG